MPAKAMLFDQSVRTLHDFGSSFYNFISFNPHSRLIALAGFGNLAGTCDIFDRRSLTKLSTIDASNTSYCEWSPDGKFLLTATLSPRLRVDNGIKVWYILGQLIHVQTCDELYQANWRPTPVDIAPQFPQAIPPAPAPSANAIAHAAVAKPTPSKTAGAYRPPGLRGQVASLVYKREDENGSPGRTPNGSGAATPNRPGRSSAPHTNGRRHVPGAPASPSPGPDSDKRRKRKGLKGAAKDAAAREGTKNGAEAASSGEANANGRTLQVPVAVVEETPVPLTPGADSAALDPVHKKIRNLNKKVCVMRSQSIFFAV